MKTSSKKRRSHKKSPLGPKYIGQLAEPIYEPVLVPGMLTDRMSEEERAKMAAIDRQIKKIPDLFSLYQIDSRSKDRWFLLAMALASAHVPGMQISFEPTRTGRPKTFKARERLHRLLRDTSVIRSKSPEKLRNRALLKELQSQNAFWRRMDIKSLEARYREARTYEEQRHLIGESLIDCALRLEIFSDFLSAP